jgi:hypothetical protein
MKAEKPQTKKVGIKLIYPKIAEDVVIDEWGFNIKLSLKDRSPNLENCITLASATGRWYFFFPVSMWPELKTRIDKMLKP